MATPAADTVPDPTKTIEIAGSKILFRHFVLDDVEASQILSECPVDERPDMAGQALRLGLILRRQTSTAINVDFVRREFQDLQMSFQTFWKEQVIQKIDELLMTCFDPKKGTLPQQLAQYFGNGRDKGKLNELFDERNTESVTYQLKQMLQKELTGENSTFLKALSPDDDGTPIGRLRKRLEEPIQNLSDKIVGKKAAEEMAEAGTQKGGPYEDLVFGYVDRVAAGFGDKAEDVSSQNVAGDYVVTLDPDTVPGQSIRLAIDAKDRPVGVKQCEDTLRDSKAQWGTHGALLVFARQEQTPFTPPVGIRRLGEGYICVFDKEDLDARILQAAYQVARLDAVRSVQRAIGRIDSAAVQEKLEQAVQKLQEFVTLKKRLTSSINDLMAVRLFADVLHRDFRDRLEEAWQALGIRTPMPPAEEV